MKQPAGFSRRKYDGGQNNHWPQDASDDGEIYAFEGGGSGAERMK